MALPNLPPFQICFVLVSIDRASSTGELRLFLTPVLYIEPILQHQFLKNNNTEPSKNCAIIFIQNISQVPQQNESLTQTAFLRTAQVTEYYPRMASHQCSPAEPTQPDKVTLLCPSKPSEAQWCEWKKHLELKLSSYLVAPKTMLKMRENNHWKDVFRTLARKIMQSYIVLKPMICINIKQREMNESILCLSCLA